MMSIYGPTADPARKHNHFVPDSYVPPRSRQKIVSPPQRTTPRSILKSPGSLRNNTPSKRQVSRVSPHQTRGASRGNQTGFPVKITQKKPQTAPQITMLKSILKSPKGSSCPIGPTSPRARSAGTSPHCSARSQSSPTGSQHQGCYVGDGEDNFAFPQGKTPLQKNVMESLGNRGPYDGSYTGNPISVVDKYDERDNPTLWKGMYRPGRRGPPAKSSLRPHARHPNILFTRVVGNAAASCSSTRAYSHSTLVSSVDDDRELAEDEDGRKCEPCCRPLDWDHDSGLKSVACEGRQAHRQCKLEEYLGEICARRRCDPVERFADYLIRCYAYANEELNSHKSKHLLGYVEEQLSCLDVWVLRLHRGTLSRLLRAGTAYSGRENELFLRMLREECVVLGSVLRRYLNETERRVHASNEQERNYKKILILGQRSPMGIMQNLRRRDWR